jgi:putative transposase
MGENPLSGNIVAFWRGGIMTGFGPGRHVYFLHHFHIVWVTKYRQDILKGDISINLREIIRKICLKESATIMKGLISKDHVRLFLSLQPKTSVDELVRKLKNTSSLLLRRDFPSLETRLGKGDVWAKGYLSHSSGDVTGEMISGYIERQGQDEDDGFTIG